MIPIAIAVTMAAMIGGIYLSFWIDSAPAPTVILLLTLVFLFAFFRRSQAKQITTG
jgi:manganese/iron transport system permease protein